MTVASIGRDSVVAELERPRPRLGSPLGNWLAPLGLMLLAVLIVSPTFVDWSWGLLDEGECLQVSRLFHGWHYPGDGPNGRFRPIHWFWYWLQFQAFGTRLLGYYLVHSLVLGISVMLVYGLVRQLGGHRLGATLGGILHLTSTPIPEAYYTLGKAEPLEALLLLLGLFAFARWATSRPRSGEGERMGHWIWLAGSLVAFCGAFLSKERAALLTAAALASGLAALWWRRGSARRSVVLPAAALAAMLIACGILFAVLAYGVFGVAAPWSGGYTSQSTGGLPPLVAFQRYRLLAPDLILLLGLGALTCLVSLRRPRQNHLLAEMIQVFCTLGALVFLVFHVVYWPSYQLYYMLAPCALVAVAAALWCDRLLRGDPRLWRHAAWALTIIVLAGSRFYSIPKAYTTAVGLIAWNRVNGQFTRHLAALPQDATVLVEYPSDWEYLYQLNLLLPQVYGRSDLSIGSTLSPKHWGAVQPGSLIAVNESALGNCDATGRGLVVLPWDRGDGRWTNGRLGGVWEPVTMLEQRRSILIPPRMQWRRFELRWRIYRLVEKPLVLTSRDAEGWMGIEPPLWVRSTAPGEELVIAGAAEGLTGRPVRIQVWRDEALLSQAWTRPGERFELSLPASAAAPGPSYTQLKLRADQSHNPESEKAGQWDLAVKVRLDEARSQPAAIGGRNNER